MAKVIFNLKGVELTIQCTKAEKMENICQKFSQKVQMELKNILFLYNGSLVKRDLTCEQQMSNQDKEKNEMKILAFDINNNNQNNDIHKTKDIICPECKENSFIKFNLFSISLSGCQNNHAIYDLSLEEFDKIQTNDFSLITCQICKKNRSDSYNNLFYKCLHCKINLCPICKNEHEKNANTHKIIDYDKINYVCLTHNDTFIKYCNDCKKNLCLKCEKEHKNHKCIYFGDIIPEDNNITNSSIKLKKNIEDLSKDIKLIFESLNNILNNLNIYYNKFNDAVIIF